MLLKKLIFFFTENCSDEQIALIAGAAISELFCTALTCGARQGRKGVNFGN